MGKGVQRQADGADLQLSPGAWAAGLRGAGGKSLCCNGAVPRAVRADQGGGDAHGGDCRAETHIVNYAKTRDVYAGYRKAGYSKKYLAEHESDILLHKAAKKAFDELGVKKLPSVKSLQEEYASCYRRKRRRMPNTGVCATRCASCCSTSRTWIVCWAKTSARRRRKRSMTGNNGHAPKRFAETRSRANGVPRKAVAFWGKDERRSG